MNRYFFVALLGAIVVWASFPLFGATSYYLDGPGQLSAEGARFSWEEAESRSLKLWVEYRGENSKWRQANLGSGFLISPSGLFVTAYHVMRYCLEGRNEEPGFVVDVNCSTGHTVLRYKARNNNGEYDVSVISHLRERDALSRSDSHTPDDIIKHRDFVIGKLRARPGARFSYWKARDFKEGKIDVHHPRAKFELKPLMPPQKVFVMGYPADRDFSISSGFLNVTEDHHRGYFAVAIDVYGADYLKNHGIPYETSWGIRVENHMSGGAVIDRFGYVIGLVTNGSGRATGVLSIENVLETFFSRSGEPTVQPAIVLTPQRRLYFRKQELKPTDSVIHKEIGARSLVSSSEGLILTPVGSTRRMEQERLRPKSDADTTMPKRPPSLQ